MFIGTGLFGRIDQVPGRCYVATRFAYVSGVPLIPLDSWAVVESNQVVSPGFMFQTITGAPFPTTEREAVQGVRVPFSWRSVGVTYLRAVLWPVHGIATAFSIIIVAVWLVFPAKPGQPRDSGWALILLTLVSTAVFGGLLLWLSYRLTRATPQRAAELFTLLGIRPPPPRKYE